MLVQAADRTRQMGSRGRVLQVARRGYLTSWRWSFGQMGAQTAESNSGDDGQAV
jgi:hypothetical protein